MTTYKVQGTLTMGWNYRFFVKCESEMIAQSIIINRLMQVKRTAQTMRITEATNAEIASAPRVLTVMEKVGA